jgi:hypothetical protein
MIIIPRSLDKYFSASMYGVLIYDQSSFYQRKLEALVSNHRPITRCLGRRRITNIASLLQFVNSPTVVFPLQFEELFHDKSMSPTMSESFLFISFSYTVDLFYWRYIYSWWPRCFNTWLWSMANQTFFSRLCKSTFCIKKEESDVQHHAKWPNPGITRRDYSLTRHDISTSPTATHKEMRF